MVLSRGWSLLLTGVGIWSWLIWPRFAVAIWDDPASWSNGVAGQSAPTGFLWVHAFLIVGSLTLGTAVGVLGIRRLLAARRRRAVPPT
ncbi:SCO4848 family membrane protein [Micromonospora sp. URMC 103]|uniref:SCO4848 family membrane protein n=1 Tax=Micromonospora sp. URMC 103 TaxID=3423406 RepID=UPI003F1A6E4A